MTREEENNIRYKVEQTEVDQVVEADFDEELANILKLEAEAEKQKKEEEKEDDVAIQKQVI